ncbi:hypothetical protein ACE6H2_005969 [Prunus campanulata]
MAKIHRCNGKSRRQNGQGSFVNSCTDVPWPPSCLNGIRVIASETEGDCWLLTQIQKHRENVAALIAEEQKSIKILTSGRLENIFNPCRIQSSFPDTDIEFSCGM